MLTFQHMIENLHSFWAAQGCLSVLPYDIEKGAGTLNPMSMLRALGPKPWRVAYVEPSRRPADGRYGDNPNRLYQHHQFQVLLKPAPDDVQRIYLDSLSALGLDLEKHDVRFVECNWENPTFGAAGVGWEVWLDGMEITQFTYFQQVGGLESDPVSVELTYGLERLACYIQNKETVYDLIWHDGVTYRDIFHQPEYEQSKYIFEQADPDILFNLFNLYEKEAKSILDQEPVMIYPAYDYILKCSHMFNMLDARGVVGGAERVSYVDRIRKLARRCAQAYVTTIEG